MPLFLVTFMPAQLRNHPDSLRQDSTPKRKSKQKKRTYYMILTHRAQVKSEKPV